MPRTGKLTPHYIPPLAAHSVVSIRWVRIRAVSRSGNDPKSSPRMRAENASWSEVYKVVIRGYADLPFYERLHQSRKLRRAVAAICPSTSAFTNPASSAELSPPCSNGAATTNPLCCVANQVNGLLSRISPDFPIKIARTLIGEMG